MNREDMIEEFTRMIDRSFEAGWEEGYRRGLSENENWEEGYRRGRETGDA